MRTSRIWNAFIQEYKLKVSKEICNEDVERDQQQNNIISYLK